MSLELLTGRLTFKSLKPIDLSCCTKQEIRAYFENSYELNESLFTAMKDATTLYKCPDRLRLPLVFYYGHTAAVYVNKLVLVGLLTERVNLKFETMFETGVDEMSWDDTENYRMGGSYKWPCVEEVVEYRRNVRNIILKLIADTPLELPITMDSPWWALVMGMEHERIHLETSSVLLRQLPVEMLQKPEDWVYAPLTAGSECEDNKMVENSGGEVMLGKPLNFPSYGWDNEYGQLATNVPAFEASKYLISNKEFLEFVRAKGYERNWLWSEEGWKWVQFRQAKHPAFWVCNAGCKSGCGADLASYSHCQATGDSNISTVQLNGFSSRHHFTNTEYRYRAMFDVLEMPWDWPVDVNYHEAKAFCRWKGPNYRLPAEAEHHLMRGTQLPVSLGTQSDVIYRENTEINHNLRFGSSTPVNMLPATDAGYHDVFGNVWQWTEDHFNGLDNFHTHFLYDDFSSPCFDGQHNIILGGSWISTGDEASRFSRFAFRRHFFQHMGFRLARSVEKDGENTLPVRLVETDIFVVGTGLLDKAATLSACLVHHSATTNVQYLMDANMPLEGILELEFGYRKSLPAEAAIFAANVARAYDVPLTSAMCVGGATGRGPFELSKHFHEVLAVEPCGRMIDAALRLQKGGSLPYGEGKQAMCDADIHADRVIFKQLTWLPNEVNQHNTVILALLDRVQNPKAWLARLWEVTARNGIAVIISPEGGFNKESLHHHLHRRLHCVKIQELSYCSPIGQAMATVTVWRHK